MLTEAELRLLPRLTAIEARFWSKVTIVDDEDSCWPWAAGTTNDGYGMFSFRGPDVPEPFRRHATGAHRVAFFLTNGFIPEMTCHSCDNPPCCRPKHLFAGTKLTNIADRHAKGRSRGTDQQGSKNHFSRLTEEDIRVIRIAASAGATDTSLAAEYEVNRATITYIVRGKTWRHVGGPIRS